MRGLLLNFIISVVVFGGCRPVRDVRPWLHDQYGPTSSPGLDLPELPRQDTTRPPLGGDGKNRLTVIDQNGKSFTARWESISRSEGAANAGALSDGAPLPKDGTGYRHIGKNPFGTDETVTFLQLAAHVVETASPGGPTILIGDISREGGGRLSPHKSHRSGRDVDIGLFAADGRTLKRFKALSPSELDADRTWAFMDVLLRTGAVQYIFIDRRLHESLFDAALRRGWSERSLSRLFEGQSEEKYSVVRHVSGHADHFHVRFRCPIDDTGCGD